VFADVDEGDREEIKVESVLLLQCIGSSSPEQERQEGAWARVLLVALCRRAKNTTATR
jgi:hypothetical protein